METMNKKTILGIITLAFGIAWLLASGITSDPVIKEHCLTRSVVFIAASFIILKE